MIKEISLVRVVLSVLFGDLLFSLEIFSPDFIAWHL